MGSLLAVQHVNQAPTARDAPELAFVLAPRQNLFFVELVEALRAEFDALGVRSSLHIGLFPEPRPDRVYVLVPPHEYFTIMQGSRGPTPDVFARTMLICGEQPETSFFEHNVRLAADAGAVFDINRLAVREFRRKGIDAQHLQLGWTPAWDHLGDGERDIDVLFLGTVSERRMRALASYGRTLNGRRAELIFSDNSRPNWRSAEGFVADEQKWQLLRRSKLVLNLHQGDAPYFEWLRIVQAIGCGAVVVSEDSVDYEPLVPGEHMLMGDVASLHLLCERLLIDEGLIDRMRHGAYELLRGRLPLADSAMRLVDAARAVAGSAPVPDRRHGFFTQPQPDPDRLPFFSRQPSLPGGTQGGEDAAWTRRALKDLRLEMLDLRRTQARLELERATSARVPAVELVDSSLAYPAATPRISVLMALYNHAAHVTDALQSLAASWERRLEVIVVDDGSSDGSGDVVMEWVARHQNIALVLLRHPVNRGLAAARNTALSLARGELCFVLDSDNEIYPNCLDRLASTLDTEPDAAFAYPILEGFSGSEAVRLVNTYAYSAERFRLGNYIDAMALMRTAVVRDELGGYPRDRRLYGWEDYALWCAMASAGHRGVLVPEILARYRVAQHSMLSLTNISLTDVYSVLIESNPELMRAIEPPD